MNSKMDQIEIIASQPESSSSSTSATALSPKASSPASPAPHRPNHNNNNKVYTEIHFNAVNKTPGSGPHRSVSDRIDRIDRKANADENRRLLPPAPAPLQLSKKFVVMPTSSPSTTPSPPHLQPGANSSNNANHLKQTAIETHPTNNSSTNPSSTTSPTPSIAGARPKHFQSMRSIRSGT